MDVTNRLFTHFHRTLTEDSTKKMRTALQRIDDSIFIRNCLYVSIGPGLWRESEQNSLNRTLIRTITLWGKKVCWKSDFCWGTSWGLDQSVWVRGTDWVSMTLNVMSWENRTTTMSGKFQRNIQLLIYFEKCVLKMLRSKTEKPWRLRETTELKQYRMRPAQHWRNPLLVSEVPVSV